MLVSVLLQTSSLKVFFRHQYKAYGFTDMFVITLDLPSPHKYGGYDKSGQLQKVMFNSNKQTTNPEVIHSHSSIIYNLRIVCLLQYYTFFVF